jgi:hypothetical protein
MPEAPSHTGRGLVNLMAELELRLVGSAPMPGLAEGSLVPDGRTYVLVLFDGLGSAQLGHADAGPFRDAAAGWLEAPFPTTTSVSLATVATGLPPSRHGQVAHLTWFEELGTVVNTLKWVDLAGNPVEVAYETVLPSPNLWERLRAGGVEPITVQPGAFDRSPLSRVLYRGARFESIWTVDEIVTATVQLAAEPGRLVFTYVPQVDYAGHVFGLGSGEFSEAMRLAAGVWEGIRAGLPDDAVLVGTADHGLAEFPEANKVPIRGKRYESLRFAGDTRGLQLWGDEALMGHLAEEVGGELADPLALIGPDPTSEARSRLGHRVLLPPDDLALLPRGFDKRLRCYHGGLSRAEVEVPLLVGS